MGHLLDALGRAYDMLGFGQATGGDEVFRQLVPARIIESTGEQDGSRILVETGVDAFGECRPPRGADGHDQPPRPEA
jgi:hypothetical protein